MKTPTRLLRAAVKQMIKEKGIDGAFALFEEAKDNYNVKEGRGYASTLAEVMALVQTIPELYPVKDRLMILTKAQRIKAGLPD